MTETSAGWKVVIRWKVRDASRTVIAWEGMTDDDHPTKFSDQAVVDPDLGEKQIDLLGPRATVTLTAYNQDGKKVISTVTCSMPRAASRPDPVEETSPHLIPTLETTHRSDTPEGTVFRVAYKALLTEDVHFEMGGEVIPLDPNDDAIALFVSRRTKLVLRAKGGGEEATKVLILAPDPKVAPEPERQQQGPPLSDHLDVISVIASQMDFSLIQPSDDYEAIFEWFLTWTSSAGEADYMQARNAICARRGYIFRTRPDLQTLFSGRRWYRGDTSDGKVLAGRLSTLETKNIAWLKAREEEQARNAKNHDG
ncbi:MAG: YARHG domain-containing protein [Fimbriimonas sp.]